MSERINRIWTVIPAAGIGSRMGADTPKQYLKIRDKCILEHTLEKFCFHPRIDGVVVVLTENDPYWPLLSLNTHDKIMCAKGGAERCHSVLSGLQHLSEMADADDWVLVHDAARPCVRIEDIDKLLDMLSDNTNGGILAVPVRDTMKRANKSNHVSETVDRKGLWHALTPQMFRLTDITAAIENALNKDLLVTDEAQAMELNDVVPILVEGHSDNIKVTHPQDLMLAELFISQQRNQA